MSLTRRVGRLERAAEEQEPWREAGRIGAQHGVGADEVMRRAELIAQRQAHLEAIKAWAQEAGLDPEKVLERLRARW